MLKGEMNKSITTQEKLITEIQNDKQQNQPPVNTSLTHTKTRRSAVENSQTDLHVIMELNNETNSAIDGIGLKREYDSSNSDEVNMESGRL